MATNNFTSPQTSFGLLPEPEGRMGSFGMSMVINVVVGALVLLLTIAQVRQVKQHNQYVAQLIFPVDAPKPIPPPVPHVKVIPPPPVLQTPPRIQLAREMPPPPKIVEVKMPTPELPKMEAAPPRRFTPPPQPKLGMFKSEAPTHVANNVAPPTLKAGGFGDPQGVKPNPNATRAATIQAIGSFNAAPGAGPTGAGAARQGSLQGVQFGSGVANGVPGGRDRGTIASAGFANGVVGGTGKPGSQGTLARASFGNDEYGAAAPRPVRQDVSPTTPIVVLDKPLPEYTAEARQLRIEGDVTLKVRFLANGAVQVLGVVSGLGHGLDEQAKLAAERIRFRPATQNGHAVDQISIIHVSFQMA
ncbi:MAG TPA: energy transducer TonB [Acidobacteriaceae bacterium]|jgi:TonB family protein|nr:energy transducer TonB [Acidobacteriaceae bacterium]